MTFSELATVPTRGTIRAQSQAAHATVGHWFHLQRVQVHIDFRELYQELDKWTLVGMKLTHRPPNG
jgi:hypothetical protein